MTRPSAPKTWLTADRLTLAGVLLLTLVVRGGVLWTLRGNLADDPDAYRQIAENVLRYGVFGMGTGSNPRPTAYRPPLYAIVLSNLATADGESVSLTKVAVLHVLLGVATVWLTWLIARKVGASRREEPAAAQTLFLLPIPHGVRDLLFPLAAAALVACDPILLHQQSLVMTETLATFLAILSLWCLTRFGVCRSWFWAGLSGGAIGLAVLCRPTFLPWLGMVGVAMLAVKSRIQNSEGRIQKDGWEFLGEFGRRIGNSAALVVMAAAMISPWAIRNYRELGKPIATTTHGGYTLYLGNNDDFYDWLGQSIETPWDAKSSDLVYPQPRAPRLAPGWLWAQKPGELQRDSLAYWAAKDTMKMRPFDCLRACVYRLRQLWSPLPHKLTADESMSRRLLRYATCAWYCGVYALAAVGIWRLRGKLVQPSWLWGVLLCLAFTAVHTFYWTNLRMRAPLMPVVALVAAAAFVRRGTDRTKADC